MSDINIPVVVDSELSEEETEEVLQEFEAASIAIDPYAMALINAEQENEK